MDPNNPARNQDTRDPGATPPAASGASVGGVAIGVDLVEHDRLAQVFARYGERFLRRVFTDREIQEAGGRIERLRGRFAAKEACAKLLGTGIGAIAWREMEIVRQPGGKPLLLLHGAAAALAASQGLRGFDLSISDTRDHTVAVVAALRA